MSNHLGNLNDTWLSSKESLSGINPDWSLSGTSGVLTVINDVKIPQSSNSVDVDGYLATIVSTADYSPFGVQLDERTESSESYRFGFNGMEKDDEMKGKGNSYDFVARIYDSRVGRFLSIDPKTKNFASLSPYNAFNSNPIVYADPTGESGIVTITPGENGNPGIIKISMDVILYGNGATPELAKTTQEAIIKRHKESKLQYMVNGQYYNVELDLKVSCLDESEVCEIAKDNKDYTKNFIRLESFNEWQKIKDDAAVKAGEKSNYDGKAGLVSEMNMKGGNGSNSGFIITDQLVKDPSVLLHELTHGWGAEHTDAYNECKNSPGVPASVPTGTKSQIFPKAPSTNGELDMKKRTLTSCDLDILFKKNGFHLNAKGLIFTGSFNSPIKIGVINNFIQDENGNNGSQRVCGALKYNQK